MEFSSLSVGQWFLVVLAALSVGIAKSGFGGVGMLTVTLMASLMPGKELESTGFVLPLLISGDILAARTYRAYVRWPIIVRLLPPAVLGVVLGYFAMYHLNNQIFRPLIGFIVLFLCGLQVLRQHRPEWFQSPERALASRRFSWATGVSAGVTTMLANAAGPLMNLYFLTVRLPKMEFVATAAWYFLIVNLIKVPFSSNLGYITGKSLLVNAALFPIVAAGLYGGKRILYKVEQERFEKIILALTIASTLPLLFPIF